MGDSSPLNTLEGERGIPNVNAVPVNKKRGGRLFMLGLLATVFVIIGLVLSWKTSRSTEPVPTQTPQSSTITSTVPQHTFILQNPEPEPIPTPKTALEMPPPMPLPSSTEKETPVLDKSGSTLMVTQTQNRGPSANTQPSSPSSSLSARTDTGLGTLLTASTTETRNAHPLKNRHMLLAKGSFIECVLQTRLDSTVPGMTSCMVTRHIYSDTGKVLLIERGSTISGEYQASIKQGQSRIFVLWSRIKTPNGVVIELDSPGTDALGGSGLPGFVDNHFWQRFGGAMMLSLVDDVATAVATSIEDSDTTITFDNTSTGAQNMATEALRSTLNIPPTLYKNQGELMGIYVARDLHFGSVYELKPN
jgi:type IV secretion system protein VirB10